MVPEKKRKEKKEIKKERKLRIILSPNRETVACSRSIIKIEYSEGFVSFKDTRKMAGLALKDPAIQCGQLDLSNIVRGRATLAVGL